MTNQKRPNVKTPRFPSTTSASARSSSLAHQLNDSSPGRFIYVRELRVLRKHNASLEEALTILFRAVLLASSALWCTHLPEICEMSYLQPRPILPSSSAVPSHSVLKQKACVPCRTRKVKCGKPRLDWLGRRLWQSRISHN